MRVVLVVGPSGSGKDTLMRAARNHFSAGKNFGFVRRYITRPPHASEDNYYVDPLCFMLLERIHFFFSSWQAHNNSYGIPRHIFDSGYDTVVCSVSRSAIAEFQSEFDTIIIEVTAEEKVLKKRLRQRGREAEPDISNRLQRAAVPITAGHLITFDNSCDLEKSTCAFVTMLQTLGNQSF